MGSTEENIRGLFLSATDVREMNPSWSDAFIEDYLTKQENLLSISTVVDDKIAKKLEDMGTDFSDGSIPFVDGGFLIEDNGRLFWDKVAEILNAKSIIVTDATATRLLATNASKELNSVASLSAWVAGTLNQITITNDGDGTITLSTPQDIGTGSDVVFQTITKSGGLVTEFLKANGSVDSTTYLTTGDAATTYIPYTGANAEVDLGAEDLTTTGDLDVASGTFSGELTTSGGRIIPPTDVTALTYTILITDYEIFLDTDGNAIIATLPAGINGQHYRIVNVGSSGNDVTLNDNATALVTTLSDDEAVILTYSTSAGGWY